MLDTGDIASPMKAAGFVQQSRGDAAGSGEATGDLILLNGDRWPQLDISFFGGHSSQVYDVLQLFRHVCEAALGITVLVAADHWELEGVLGEWEMRRFSDLSRMAYPDTDAMRGDKPFMLLLILFCYFYFSEVVVSMRIVWTLDATGFFGLAKVLVPGACFFLGLAVFYPPPAMSSDILYGASVFRLLVGAWCSVFLLRTLVRFWVIRWVADAHFLDCASQIRQKCWFISSLFAFVSGFLLLVADMWVDMKTNDLHRDASSSPPRELLTFAGLSFFVSWALSLPQHCTNCLNNHVNTSKGFRILTALRCILSIVYASVVGTILLNYFDTYAELVLCDDTNNTVDCHKCNEGCGVMGYAFLLSTAPPSHTLTTLRQCYSNGMAVMSIGEFCDVRDSIGHILGSYLVIIGFVGIFVEVANLRLYPTSMFTIEEVTPNTNTSLEYEPVSISDDNTAVDNPDEGLSDFRREALTARSNALATITLSPEYTADNGVEGGELLVLGNGVEGHTQEDTHAFHDTPREEDGKYE